MVAQASKWEALRAPGQPWDRVSLAMTVDGIITSGRASVDQLRKAAKSFKLRTTAVEGWHPDISDGSATNFWTF